MHLLRIPLYFVVVIKSEILAAVFYSLIRGISDAPGRAWLGLIAAHP